MNRFRVWIAATVLVASVIVIALASRTKSNRPTAHRAEADATAETLSGATTSAGSGATLSSSSAATSTAAVEVGTLNTRSASEKAPPYPLEVPVHANPFFQRPPLSGDYQRDMHTYKAWIDSRTEKLFGARWNDDPADMVAGSWSELVRNPDGSSQGTFVTPNGARGHQWILPDGTVAIEELDYGDAGKILRFKSYGEAREDIITYTKGKDGFSVSYHPNGYKKSSSMWIDDQTVVDLPDNISQLRFEDYLSRESGHAR